ncbi:hypothetical protein HMPREF3293_01386 [Christensenella minuta]|uniref:Uncharacterized protein n=1 Tax=Christensenella minuta TaxID=626937 RepID=A0A136Q557_9FIRM|nr:hypothetical protein HMPREF3293_01386 [Christensenella minuta]
MTILFLCTIIQSYFIALSVIIPFFPGTIFDAASSIHFRAHPSCNQFPEFL